MKKLAVILMLGLVAACGQRQAAETPPTAQAPSYDAQIGPSGAAGIGSALAMNEAAIGAAAPHYAVASVQDQIEGQPFTAITLSAGNEEVFRLLPSADGAHVHSIVTKSSLARGPEQEVVGVTLFGAAAPEVVDFCKAESIDGAPGFACSTAQNGRFWLAYRLPEGYDGPSDPFDAIDPDVLHDATLAEMRWIAP